MKRDDSLKLLSEVRDLQIVDCDGRNCGICDDVELDGAPGEPLFVRNLLVGPGTYRNRLPGWAAHLVRRLAGRSMVRVAWQAVEKISGRIFLSQSGASLGLRRIDDRLSKLFGRIPSA
jgi:hypothetical protein